MELRKEDCRVETMRGTGNGGQHRNKTDSACRITHIPTGLSAYADERSQKHSKRLAWAELERRLQGLEDERRAADKKARRDHAIHNTEIVRTYDFKANRVKDHRTKKAASIKDVLVKGKIELVAPEPDRAPKS